MKELFYGILLILLIGFIDLSLSVSKKLNLDHRKDGVIINISNNWIGCNVKVKMENDSIYNDYVYQIAIINLEVGDTIN